MDLNKFPTTTLYFTAGAVATEVETEEARNISRGYATNVRIRNGSAPINGGLEKCDYVAGTTIPNAYALKYPKIGEANEAPQETQPEATDTGNASGPAAGGEGSQSSPSSLASQVGSVSGGWGNTP